MSKNDFLTKENVSLLWEVIMDDDLMKNKQQSEVSQIIDIFNVNLKKFHASTNNNNLTELNKNYITVMINFINKNFNKPIVKNNINQNQKKDLITYEEIQNDRLSQFERDYNNRQQEFTSAMSLPVPEAPDFSDKTDGPLTEIEVEVKRYMAQRNYDVEQLNKTMDNNNNNQGKANTWLKPQETSLKAEKNPLNLNLEKKPVNSEKNPLKYIKIDNSTKVNENVIQNDVIDLNDKYKKKTISWADNFKEDEEQIDDVISGLDIFSKLKTITTKKDNNSNNNDDIVFLKNEIKVLHQKLDTILGLLNNHKY
jgi:hypothetical protein